MRFVINRSSVRIRRVVPNRSSVINDFPDARTDIRSLTGRIVREVSAFVKIEMKYFRVLVIPPISRRLSENCEAATLVLRWVRCGLSRDLRRANMVKGSVYV